MWLAVAGGWWLSMVVVGRCWWLVVAVGAGVPPGWVGPCGPPAPVSGFTPMNQRG